jgi:hypothetical protein
MKLWIARDLSGMLSFHYERPRYISGRGWINVWAIPNSSLFPEVTFENSPQEVEIKLVENG